MKNKYLVFPKPYEAMIQEEMIGGPAPDEVLIAARLSAVSAGTELLFYRGEVPPDMTMDEKFACMQKKAVYPIRYGYAVVGKVIETGKNIPPEWKDRLVFAFHPHESCFTAKIEDLLPLPEGIEPEDAVFLPFMETALNFLLDGNPLVGEAVCVIGLGVLGLLTTALLSKIPLETLKTIDPVEKRREISIDLGATGSSVPGASLENERAAYDLVYEMSGNPDALNEAMELTCFDGKIVMGSWYGINKAPLNLGGSFHRKRVKMLSSQVSTISPSLSGRWTKKRRLSFAWKMLQTIKPSGFITHRFPIYEADKAFDLLNHKTGDILQVVFTYD